MYVWYGIVLEDNLIKVLSARITNRGLDVISHARVGAQPVAVNWSKEKDLKTILDLMLLAHNDVFL